MCQLAPTYYEAVMPPLAWGGDFGRQIKIYGDQCTMQMREIAWHEEQHGCYPGKFYSCWKALDMGMDRYALDLTLQKK